MVRQVGNKKYILVVKQVLEFVFIDIIVLGGNTRT